MTLQRQMIAGAGPATRHFAEPRFGHNFGEVRVHADQGAGEAPGAVNSLAGMAMPQFGRRSLQRPFDPSKGGSMASTLFQVPEDAPEDAEDTYDAGVQGAGDSSGTQQIGDGDTQTNGPDGQGSAVPTSDSPPGAGGGAPLCHNGGGSSDCDISSGEYKIISNDNSCCTRDCTQQHEARHVQDLGACCKKASDAARGSAAPEKVVNMYKQWVDKARPTTECNAYRNDVKCATAMEKANDCNGKGKDSTCCVSIRSYEIKYSEQADKYCKMAQATLPPCPNFDLAPMLP